MDEELYKHNILDHYKHPRNYGALLGAQLCESGRNPSCGDDLTLYATVDTDQKVTEAAFEGAGCAISVAAASMLTDRMKGKTISELKLLTPGDVYDMLGIAISAGRVNCALLAYGALERMLKNI